VLSPALEFRPSGDPDFFAAVPAVPAVFLLRGNQPEAQPYVSKTSNLRRRLQRLLGSPAFPGRKLNLRDWAHSVEYALTGSDFESTFLLYATLKTVFPETYGERLRLRFAPLLKLHMENEYPRVSITTRLGRIGGRSLYYGPFPSRVAAEKFANDSLDFFKMRRCVDDLHPDPSFPGCIYSEMAMCLAPCFKGCTDEQYREEVAQVRGFFDSAGDSLVSEIAAQRDAASANLEFENASALHLRLDRIKSVQGQLPEIVRRLDVLTGLMIQPSATPECVTFFRIDGGLISGPIRFGIQAADSAKSHSLEARIQEALDATLPMQKRTALELMEHLAMLKRWYYRSHRSGEIFLADNSGDLPFRRIARGIGRVYRRETPETQPIPGSKSS
jgi:excinuclease ABC subunit C